MMLIIRVIMWCHFWCTGGVVYHLRSEATLFWPRVRVTPWLASLYLMFYVVYKLKKRTSLSICKRLTTEGLASEIRRKSELSVGAQSQCENASVASRIGGKFVGRVTTGPTIHDCFSECVNDTNTYCKIFSNTNHDGNLRLGQQYEYVLDDPKELPKDI